jgi:Sec-independent protein translocase protein (TatC)
MTDDATATCGTALTMAGDQGSQEGQANEGSPGLFGTTVSQQGATVTTLATASFNGLWPSPGTKDSAELDGAGGAMTLFEHLAELRKRVLICAVAVVVTSVAGYFLYNPVLHFMTGPYRSFYHHHKDMITSQLVISSPGEGFTTRLKVSMYVGRGAGDTCMAVGIVAVHHPPPQKERKAIRSPVRPIGSGVVLDRRGHSHTGLAKSAQLAHLR